MRGLLDFYITNAKIAIMQQFQYPVANYFYMIGMVAEPVIYLVVWSTVARAQGGSVAGYTPGAFAAYYITWTLVRNMNIVLTPFAWDWRIRTGMLSAELLRPLHPLHGDISYFGGWKVVVIVLWLPIAAVLSLIFHPTFNTGPLQLVVFFVAIWGAFLIRTMLLWLLGLISLWTTRVAAIFELYFASELLLSGRLVPLALMPGWAQRLARVLPFQWTFGFPIESLIGQLAPRELGLGLLAQLLWITIGVVLVGLVWRSGIRRFSAVGS